MNYNPVSIFAGIVLLSTVCFLIASGLDFLFIKFFDKKNENEWSKTSAIGSVAVITWLLSVTLALWIGSPKGLVPFVAVFLVPFFSVMYFVSGKIYKLSLPKHLFLIALFSIVLNPVWLTLMGAL